MPYKEGQNVSDAHIIEIDSVALKPFLITSELVRQLVAD